MKKHLLRAAVVLLHFTSPLVAQPILTASGINPNVGESYKIKTSNPFSAGNGGANQIWNFAPIGMNSVYSYTNTSVASTPYAASFSTSGLSLQSGTGYDFYKPMSTALQYTGGANQSIVLPYYDAFDMLRFPFNFNDSYTDAFGAISSTGTYTIVGTYTVTYDGYGSLILPNGGSSSFTLTNVARVHYQSTVEEQGTGGSISGTLNEYRWYVNGIHHMAAYTQTVTGSQNYQSYGYSTDLFTSLNEAHTGSFDIIPYPNPASEVLTFKTSQNPDIKTIELCDLAGKLYLSKTIDHEKLADLSIDVFALATGMYFVKFIMHDGASTIKKILIN